jgi:F0F1-type ATP synthase assembly protein I
LRAFRSTTDSGGWVGEDGCAAANGTTASGVAASKCASLPTVIRVVFGVLKENRVKLMLSTENDKYGVSSIVEAMKWVSVVTSVVGVMIVPALGGIWIDSLLGTKCLFTILGVAFGFVGGMYSLLDMVKGNADHPESLRR